MDFHLVGGFLGSGKTTAIIGAARRMLAQGKTVGIVTNDQGRRLVDTAFFRSQHFPTVEVTGGCFCCNYDDLAAQLRQLRASALPDAIFAESVGSCADIVATVVKPFLELNRLDFPLTSYTVFTDARLLRRRLRNQPMPFGDDVVYIFDKQIEEAGLLVMNKSDLLTASEANELRVMAQVTYPGKVIHAQNSRADTGIASWLERIQKDRSLIPHRAVNIDYDRYAAGEAELAWLDEAITVTAPEGRLRTTLIALIDAIRADLRQSALPVGHVKFHLAAVGVEAKLSLPTLLDAIAESDIPEFTGNTCSVLINARVQTASDILRDCIKASIERAMLDTGARFEVVDLAHFHPGYPHPTHRIK